MVEQFRLRHAHVSLRDLRPLGDHDLPDLRLDPGEEVAARSTGGGITGMSKPTGIKISEDVRERLRSQRSHGKW
ncbi:hypothetical protein [Streptomyces djakartensis]|uniref:hypothetical protein n=1 Tax=Streptomyces djakartensis TaxID=68193 RepID=UPI0034DFF51F